MATMFVNESSIEKLVTSLIYLEHDAIAAYDSTIDKLKDEAFKTQVTSFREDHRRHLSTLQEMARQAGAEIPAEGDAKQILTTGKVAMANMFGDSAILKEMKTNEDDTVTAYKRACGLDYALLESKAFFMKALHDEERHRSWFENAAKAD